VNLRPLLFAALLLRFSPVQAEPPSTPVWRMAFGSCARSNLPQPFWGPIRALQPQVWCWLGDNIYADTTDIPHMRRLYAAQRAVPGYAALIAGGGIAVLGTWDDHDYGANDAGREYPRRVESQREILDFLDEPSDSARRTREGIYTSRTFAQDGRSVKVILLDTRYHRDPIGSNGTVLGEEQWKWFAAELGDSKADVHIVVTSIQAIAEEHRFEKWANFPDERRRLFGVIAASRARGVILISGDRHHAEISRLATGPANPVAYPIYEITSSSLTHSRNPQAESNRHRVGLISFERNFGLIEINWATGNVRFRILGQDGGTLLEAATPLSALSPP